MRDRVQREATGALGGVVTEEQRDDAVADLVQDDRQEQAGEEDEALFDLGAQVALVELSGGWTRS